jgi:tRNA pseudouridine55 synthase
LGNTRAPDCSETTVDGLLVIDKPAGLTSHDVVAAARRILRESRVGHTGTLDPAATGVLPLVIGRATRLARFVSACDKSYTATIALGVSTDTADAAGQPIGEPYRGVWPARDAIERALDEFRGTFLQRPPAYSAKKIAGRRSYELARAGDGSPADRPEPVTVTLRRASVTAVDGSRITLEVDCSAGFYVRSLAHDLGERLGTGGHLAALRRTRTGEYTLDDAIALDEAIRDPEAAVGRVVPMSRMLQTLPAAVLTPDGVKMAKHGRMLASPVIRNWELGMRNYSETVMSDASFLIPNSGATAVRLLSDEGDLVGVADSAGSPAVLHPSVVLM